MNSDFWKTWAEERDFIQASVRSSLKEFKGGLQDLAGFYIKANKYGSLLINPWFVLFPWWLSSSPQLRVKIGLVKKIGLANAYGNIHFRIQDDLLDEPATYSSELLLISNIFFARFIEEYRQLFPNDRKFWRSFEQNILEYAEVTYQEKTNSFLGELENLHDKKFLIRLGRKIAPLKICCTAIALIKKKEEKIKALFTLVDFLGAANQLINDLCGWQEDLNNNNSNYLLAVVTGRGQVQLEPREIYARLLLSNHIESILHKSNYFYNTAKSLALGLGSLQVVEYIDFKVNQNLELRAEVEQTKSFWKKSLSTKIYPFTISSSWN